MNSLSEFSSRVRQQVDGRLDSLLQNYPGAAPGLIEAMRYATLNGGKRIRPLLVFAAAELCDGAEPEAVLNCACALEMIHAYSLVHDDLPAMDDDDLRRGRPTLHLAYDEATAILAGDALQSAAFEQLATTAFPSSSAALACMRELAAAAGVAGMAGGQYIDLQAAGNLLDLPQLERMHRLKTGALISAALRMGALACGEPIGSGLLTQLDSYGEHIGLAFQIQDDILDATGDTGTLGKTAGADQHRSKPTFVSLLGVEGAKAELEKRHRLAIQALEGLNEGSHRLIQLAEYLRARNT